MTQQEYGKAYEEGFSRTVRMLRCRGASIECAEDVAQAAWLQGWRKLEQLRDQNVIVAWVNMIAINFHRRAGVKEARYQALPEVELCGAVGIDSVPLDVAKILKMCRPRDCSLFQQQLDGLTPQEIAKKQGVSATSVRIRLLRARRSVRVRLEDSAVALQNSFRIHQRTAA